MKTIFGISLCQCQRAEYSTVTESNFSTPSRARFPGETTDYLWFYLTCKNVAEWCAS